MTVTIVARHEISKTDENDTCNRQTFDNNLLKDCSNSDDVHNKETQKQNNQNSPDEYESGCCPVKPRKLLVFNDAPHYLKHNIFILSGYRGLLNTQLCMESVFWWTNETVNIWSHIFGFALFLGLSLRDVMAINVYAHLSDKLIVAVVLICFQACMLLSALYHTFSCRSEKDCDFFLSIDLFGIALSLLAIYTSGIYYAFWCEQAMQNFYLITITVIFIGAMTLQIPRFQINSHVKMLVFVGWAAYGVLPTLHWTFYMGGLENPIVQLLLPRVLGMYVISGTAFLIYVTKIPERFCSGKFDYLGHSHQWWHLFVVVALYYWHNSGMVYLQYRFNHACNAPEITTI